MAELDGCDYVTISGDDNTFTYSMSLQPYVDQMIEGVAKNMDAAVEAEVVRVLRERGWTCTPPTDAAREPEPPTRERDPVCVERWPECASFEYDPRCCRFPKSCSASIVPALQPEGTE